MAKDILCLKLKNLRAIQEAEIKVNGITLVSGVNGCGKSTISKMLYHLIEGVSNYNELAEKFFEIWMDRYMYAENLRKCLSYLNNLEPSGNIDDWNFRFIANHKEILTLFEEVYTRYIGLKERINEGEKERIVDLLTGATKLPKENSIDGILKLILEHLEAIQSKVKCYQDDRPNKIILPRLYDAFHILEINESEIDLIEAGDQVFSREESSVKNLIEIDKAIYLDSPFVLNNGQYPYYRGGHTLYWSELNKLLRETNPLFKVRITEELCLLMRQEVLHGESIWDESKSEYLFTREDGKKFNLLDCATGEKSLSILQMLLNNGWLNKSTLLIMDEPEVHLHPQWVVEYARLIVLLNKHIGVKFFLASHNPDLVSAIKYISEKEGLGNALNFYLAEKSEDNNYQFVYRELGQDIEPIFQSFNIALDRIDAYGRMQDDD